MNIFSCLLILQWKYYAYVFIANIDFMLFEGFGISEAQTRPSEVQ